MRKIERDMVAAIKAGKPFRSGNTVVRQLVGGGWRVELHGNAIAWAAGKNRSNHYARYHGVQFDHCGWKTATTKSRINAIISGVLELSAIRLYQRDGEWLVMQNGEPRRACDRACYRCYFIRP